MSCEYSMSTFGIKSDACFYEHAQVLVKKFINGLGEVNFRIDQDVSSGKLDSSEAQKGKDMYERVIGDSISPWSSITPCQSCPHKK